VMTNILSNLGRLGAQEIKDLFGVPSNYNLPPSMLSQVYFGNRQDAEKGELKSLPLGRFNPFLNSLTQLESPKQSLGLVSPLYQMLADQVFEQSTFTGRTWRIDYGNKGYARATPAENERPRNYFGSALGLFNPGAYSVPGHAGAPRNRILESNLLNLAFPYRLAEQSKLGPNQADDALLWRPSPMEYAPGKAEKGVKKSRREFAKRPLAERIGGQLLPVIPRQTQAPAVIKREREREAYNRALQKRKPGARRKRRKSGGYTYSSGSGSGGINWGG
jgi:hypothetical protein